LPYDTFASTGIRRGDATAGFAVVGATVLGTAAVVGAAVVGTAVVGAVGTGSIVVAAVEVATGTVVVTPTMVDGDIVAEATSDALALTCGPATAVGATSALVDAAGVVAAGVAASLPPHAASATTAAINARRTDNTRTMLPDAGRNRASAPSDTTALDERVGHTGGVQLQSATATVQRVLRYGAVVAVVAAFVLVFRKSWRDLDEVQIQLRPGLLIGGLIFSFVTVGTLPLCWNRLLAAYGPPLGQRTSISVWWGAQAARYLPTGLVGFAARAVLAERHGIAKRITIATVVMELGQFVSWAAIFAGVPGEFAPWANGALIAGGVAGLAAMALATHPEVAAKLRLPVAHRSALAIATGSYGLSIVVRLVRAPLVFAAIGGVAHSNIAAIIAVDCLAIVAGIVGFTPAGIGTREAVIVGLLEARLGLGMASALAASLRMWDLVIEGSWLVVAGGLLRGRTRRSEPA
jgi:hypothetical protein